jgi:hypothetical protein
MIQDLKQDSLRFESENRRRVSAGRRPQIYDPLSQMDAYEDRNASPMSREDGRHAPRWSQAHAYGDDNMDLDMDLDMDYPTDSRDPRYYRETYDAQDPHARLQVPAGYVQPGRDSYLYGGRSDPRLDPRDVPRLDPRSDPQLDPRDDPRLDPRSDPRLESLDPRSDST